MKVMAHRGYSGVYPENTMLSFREAVKVGCDAIEMDVHETRDGRLVVIHDERLDRTTDGSGRCFSRWASSWACASASSRRPRLAAWACSTA